MIRLSTARYYTPTGRSIQKPYETGKLEFYNRELIDRYNRGEMVSADSIHFPDSLKYSTLKKHRIVYGGGGIMPDYFVPIDTDTNSWYFVAAKTELFRELGRKSILYKFVNNLIDNNRSNLLEQYPNFDLFSKKFVVSDKMINELLEQYKKEKAEELKEKTYQLTDEQQSDLGKAKQLIQFQIKALAIREILGENEYYHFVNEYVFYNDALKKAMEIMNHAAEYDKLLGK
jgi:carboxyl-terminal processing protease